MIKNIVGFLKSSFIAAGASLAAPPQQIEHSEMIEMEKELLGAPVSHMKLVHKDTPPDWQLTARQWYELSIIVAKAPFQEHKETIIALNVSLREIAARIEMRHADRPLRQISGTDLDFVYENLHVIEQAEQAYRQLKPDYSNIKSFNKAKEQAPVDAPYNPFAENAHMLASFRTGYAQMMRQAALLPEEQSEAARKPGSMFSWLKRHP